MRRTNWVLAVAVAAAAAVVVVSGGDALAKKGGGGGGGGDPGNTTPLDILFQFHINNVDPTHNSLYAMQDDGSGQTLLTTCGGKPSWSPDGTEVAFWGDADGPGIYVMSIGGGEARKVVATNTTYGSDVAWSPVPSPDGEFKLAFTDSPLEPDGTYGKEEVFLVNLDGTGLRDVSQLEGINARCNNVSWSSDGARLAFLFGFTVRVLDLERLDASGVPAQDTVYSSSAIHPWQAEWAKTSDTIVFAAVDGSTTSPLGDLYVIAVGFSTSAGAWVGSIPVNITNTPDDEERMPSWSPDDTRIVCKNAHWRSNRKGVATLSLDAVPVGTGARSTILSGDADYPIWKRSTP